MTYRHVTARRFALVLAAVMSALLLGHGTAGALPQPVTVTPQAKSTNKVPRFTSLGVGHTSGYVVSWDFQERQNVGLPTEVTREYVSQDPARRIVSVAVGATFAMALTKAGSVLAWSTAAPRPTITPPGMGSGIKAIVAGAAHAYAIDQQGRVIAWGTNTCGQLDVPASAQSGVVSVSTSYCHSLALKEDGTVVAWGTPPDPYSCDQNKPPHQQKYCYDYPPPGPLTVPEAGRNAAASVHASDYGAYVVKRDGTVISWYYLCEQLPYEFDSDPKFRCGYTIQEPSTSYLATTSADRLIPLEASSDVVEIQSSGLHRIAVKRDGSIVEWGHRGFEYLEGAVWLRKGSGRLDSPVKIRGGMVGDWRSYWETCTFALDKNGTFGVGCPKRIYPYVQGTPSIAWDRVIDFDARYWNVVALIGMDDAPPGGIKDVDAYPFTPNSRNVMCIVHLYSDDPLLGPPAPAYPGEKPVRNLKMGTWFEYRPVGRPDAPWTAAYPWAQQYGWSGIVPDVQLTFRCGTRASKRAKVTDVEIRVANTFGHGPSRSTVGPPPRWSG